MMPAFHSHRELDTDQDEALETEIERLGVVLIAALVPLLILMLSILLYLYYAHP
jgi:hypothetical protein